MRHLFCQVDNHDGVAGDRSTRIGRSVLDLLPVVHPVDLEGYLHVLGFHYDYDGVVCKQMIGFVRDCINGSDDE